MPKIEDIKTSKKNFKKSNYRPWNFLEELEKESTENVDQQNLSSEETKPQQQNVDEEQGKKPETKRGQTDNKPTTNWQQTDNKLATNRQQTDNISVIDKPRKEETDNKLATQPTTEVTTNWQQTDNKPTTNASFSSLIGLQRSIVIFIYQECKTTRSKISDPITLEHLSSYLKCSSGTAKTTLQRLEAKKYIVRKEFKNGRGGWSRYEIPEKLFHELLQKETGNKPTTNWQQTDNKLATQPATQPTTSLSSSSSNIYITTTTDLPEEWKNFDLAPLKDIGLTFDHLMQLYKQGGYTPEIIQNSIYHFAFDLEHNNKANEINKTSPLGYFMGIMKRIGVYAAPSNYESPKDRAMRIYLERQRQIEEKQQKMQEELFALAFQEWFKSLSDDDRKLFLPTGMQYTRESKSLEAIAKNHFKEKVWRQEQEKFLNQF